MSVMSWPLKITLPCVGSSRMLMQRSSVDLPEPDGPMNTTTSLRHDLVVYPLEDVEIAEPFVDPLEAHRRAASFRRPPLIDPRSRSSHYADASRRCSRGGSKAG